MLFSGIWRKIRFVGENVCACVSMADSNSGESFDGFTGSLASDIDVADVADVNSDVSVSSISSESDTDDVRPLPAAVPVWTDQVTPVHQCQSRGTAGGCIYCLPKEATEQSFFERLFSHDLPPLIVRETNGYASRQGATRWIDVTVAELSAFIDIHMVLSITYLPSYKLARTSKWPFSLHAIPDLMTRSRFETIERYLHCNDTQHNPARGQPSHDKLCHIRPILDDVTDKCKNNYNPHKEQSIDEAMIGFKGRLGLKQYLPAKPTRFGIKVWVRANACNGYISTYSATGKRRSQSNLGETGEAH